MTASYCGHYAVTQPSGLVQSLKVYGSVHQQTVDAGRVSEINLYFFWCKGQITYSTFTFVLLTQVAGGQ